MKVFDCKCKYRFIVARKQVYGPIFAMDLPGHFTGDNGCHHRGRLMSREDFEDQYADCARQFERQEGPGAADKNAEPLCYKPHFDGNPPNPTYLPHVHIPKTDSRGRAVVARWEDKPHEHA